MSNANGAIRSRVMKVLDPLMSRIGLKKSQKRKAEVIVTGTEQDCCEFKKKGKLTLPSGSSPSFGNGSTATASTPTSSVDEVSNDDYSYSSLASSTVEGTTTTQKIVRTILQRSIAVSEKLKVERKEQECKLDDELRYAINEILPEIKSLVDRNKGDAAVKYIRLGVLASRYGIAMDGLLVCRTGNLLNNNVAIPKAREQIGKEMKKVFEALDKKFQRKILKLKHGHQIDQAANLEQLKRHHQKVANVYLKHHQHQIVKTSTLTEWNNAVEKLIKGDDGEGSDDDDDNHDDDDDDHEDMVAQQSQHVRYPIVKEMQCALFSPAGTGATAVQKRITVEEVFLQERFRSLAVLMESFRNYAGWSSKKQFWETESPTDKTKILVLM
jgi:hypothetical protein